MFDSQRQDAAQAAAGVEGNSPRPEAQWYDGDIDNSGGEFPPAPPGPNDTVEPAPGAEPPTTDTGNDVGYVNPNDAGEGRVNAAMLNDEPVTTQDMSREY